jgi:hypothetical protein
MLAFVELCLSMAIISHRGVQHVHILNEGGTLHTLASAVLGTMQGLI